MPIHHRCSLPFSLLLGAALASLAVCAAAQGIPAATEGLVKIPSRQLGAVYLAPGTDFKTYMQIIIDPVQVSFRKGWLKDINSSRGVSRKISEQDAQQIAAAIRTGFQDTFAAEFKAKGYGIANAPAPDVLRVSAEVANVYINAPDPTGSAAVRTYTVQAGEATLALAARDSTTGAVLGVVVDRRTTGGMGRATLTTTTSNQFEFEELFRDWARACVRGLDRLKAQSPINTKADAKG